MTDARAGCVLDASAVLALLHSEPGAEMVEAVLEHAAISTVNWSEVCWRWIAHAADRAWLEVDLGVEIRVIR